MKTLFLFSLVILLITGTYGQTDTTTEETTSTTSITTESPTTTTVTPDTTTTPAPTTTKSTTTTSTTTTTQATTTTTKEPVTTFPPSTTTKIPEPDDCTFNVTQGNITCIRADLKVSFIVSIEGKDNHLNLGCKAKYEPTDCSSNGTTQTLSLYESTYNFTMVFEKDKDKFSVKDIIFEYNIPAGRGVVSSNNTILFSVKTGSSYLCKTKSDVKIDNVTISFEEIHVQAFLTKEDTNFGSAEECDADDKVSDVVPIAVGVALAALIIIVLIAYLVGRRRSRQSGYQSV
jgi:lysosomal-associated membrane protein 1/2